MKRIFDIIQNPIVALVLGYWIGVVVTRNAAWLAS